jgi:putative oxidoreductase
MKYVFVMARLLLGLIFTVFGLNGFLHFIANPPLAGLAGQFMGALAGSHYYVVVFGTQLIGGVLLLSNRYVPLALTLLGPVLVNILSFHIFLSSEHGGCHCGHAAMVPGFLAGAQCLRGSVRGEESGLEVQQPRRRARRGIVGKTTFDPLN